MASVYVPEEDNSIHYTMCLLYFNPCIPNNTTIYTSLHASMHTGHCMYNCNGILTSVFNLAASILNITLYGQHV